MHLTPHLLLSATDLTRFKGCQHAIVLDLAHLRGEGPEPTAASEDAALLQKQGEDHEAAHLDTLKSDGRRIVEIPRGPLAKAAEATRAAMAEGADVIYQAAFLSGQSDGRAVFLKTHTPSILHRRPQSDVHAGRRRCLKTVVTSEALRHRKPDVVAAIVEKIDIRSRTHKGHGYFGNE